MNAQVLIDRLAPLIKRNLLIVTLACFGLIFLVYGLISLIGSSQNSNGLNFQEGTSSAALEASSENFVKNMVVDVEGAVIKPGVYRLSQDARVSDALIAASGLSEEADRQWIEKNLNLAARLKDGSKIYIPRVGEGTESATYWSQGSSAQAGVITNETGIVSQQSGLINVNTASLSELDTLKGIGPVTAQRIIDNRPYNSINDLVNKKTVSQKVFEGIKAKITVN